MRFSPIDFKAIIYNSLEDRTREIFMLLKLQNKNKNLTFNYVRNAKKKDPLIQVTIITDEGEKEIFKLRFAILSPKYIGISVTNEKNPTVSVLTFQIFSKKLKDILLSYRDASKNALYRKYLLVKNENENKNKTTCFYDLALKY